MRNANCAFAQLAHFAQLAKLANYFAQRPPLWKTHSKHSQTAAERIDVIISLSTKLPWPGDSEGTFLSLTQAACHLSTAHGGGFALSHI